MQTANYIFYRIRVWTTSYLEGPNCSSPLCHRRDSSNIFRGCFWYIGGAILHHLEYLLPTHLALVALVSGSYCYKINHYKMQLSKIINVCFSSVWSLLLAPLSSQVGLLICLMNSTSLYSRWSHLGSSAAQVSHPLPGTRGLDKVCPSF